MQQIATITSKRQLTIPAAIFRQLGFKKGHKVLVSLEDKSIRITSALDLVEDLAGSVRLPKGFRGMGIGQIVQKAKQSYFGNKK